jgi:hypothetical protein
MFEGRATYIWEALGAFAAGEKLHEEYSDDDVQYDKHVAKLDLPEDKQDTQPIYRYQEHSGYLGQGGRRAVVLPGRSGGVQLFTDDPLGQPDVGVFEESLALDGSWTVRSAHSVVIGKRVLIPVPKRKRLSADQSEGDDKEKGNYKFAGQFGGGDDHKVGDITNPEGELPHLLTVAGVQDILSYHYNWKGLHPFHYHKEDFGVPEESMVANSEKQGPQFAQDQLSFGELAGEMYLQAPTPSPMEVDHRYGAVDYFARESFFTLLPDGGVVIGDGYGSQLTMTGGSIRLDCPGDVMLTPGRSIIGLGGDDIVLRAQNSLDATAGSKDLRLKAGSNLQIVSGVQGVGGILLDDQSNRTAFDFKTKVGEDVISSGIVLKSKVAPVAIYGGEIYMRTGEGGNPLESGKITLDASKGKQKVIIKGAQVQAFCQSGFDIAIGPEDENNEVSAPFAFDSSGMKLGGDLDVQGGLAVKDGVILKQGVEAAGSFSSGASDEVEKVPAGRIRERVDNRMNPITAKKDKLKDDHKTLFPDDLYKTGDLGNDKLIEEMEFSFRDDQKTPGKQYNTESFELLESRWQQMVRLGSHTGGVAWIEGTLQHTSGPQLPWPGKKKWEDEDTLRQLQELTMFDANARHSFDRGGAFEEPTFGELTRTTPKSGFKVIL